MAECSQKRLDTSRATVAEDQWIGHASECCSGISNRQAERGPLELMESFPVE